MPHLSPQKSIQLQDRPGLTLLQRNSGFPEENLTLQVCREPDRSTTWGISFKGTSWNRKRQAEKVGWSELSSKLWEHPDLYLIPRHKILMWKKVRENNCYAQPPPTKQEPAAESFTASWAPAIKGSLGGAINSTQLVAAQPQAVRFQCLESFKALQADFNRENHLPRWWWTAAGRSG